jgi:hypothetical protein
MELCPICLEEMDMNSFQDERQQTATSFKLECGHAYHTRCIIQCLSFANQKCPNCHKNKSPADELTREGFAKRLIDELKKVPEVRVLITELRETVSEFGDTMSVLKQDVKDFVKKRSEELLIEEKRKYMLSCISKILSECKTICKTKGPQYTGALTTRATGGRYWRGTTFERIFFGINEAYRIHRLKSPSLYIRL